MAINPKDKIPFCNNDNCCTSPAQLFTIATSFAIFLSTNFTVTELETLSNLLTLIVANLNSIITQQEICNGDFVEEPIELDGI